MTSHRVSFVLLAVALMASAAVAAQTCPAGVPRVAPDSRYVDHGDGTVTDRQTGLMWKRCSEGQSGEGCAGALNTQNWAAALATAADANFAGHSDWRLPAAKELNSLVETGCHSPAINSRYFPNTPHNRWWTSTTVAAAASQAWTVGFEWGGVGGNFKSAEFGVRLVRAGN